MKIAQIGPLWENIPPLTYGGTERVIHELTEHLVQTHHQVTLFACGTSTTSAELVSVYPRPLFRDNIPWTNLMYPLLNLTAAFDRAKEFDIIHVHLNKASDYLALPLAEAYAHKTLFTLHFPYPTTQGRYDRHAVLQKYRELNYISLSDAQRQGGENLNWLGTVHNGINVNSYTFNSEPKDYVIWLGKFNPDKGVHEAILAARQAKVKLLLAGSIDHLEAEDLAYYQTKIEPYIDNQQVIYLGEINDQQKNKYLGEALALLNPIKWQEPFGLTMVEALACGTPVIAFAQGAAPEIITDGQTGFLVDTIEAMAAQLKNISQLKRQACRQRAEAHFSSPIMTQRYLEVYHQLIHS
jgi:glycosyltransferase involved in cell wall biosynthesis